MTSQSTPSVRILSRAMCIKHSASKLLVAGKLCSDLSIKPMRQVSATFSEITNMLIEQNKALKTYTKEIDVCFKDKMNLSDNQQESVINCMQYLEVIIAECDDLADFLENAVNYQGERPELYAEYLFHRLLSISKRVQREGEYIQEAIEKKERAVA